MFIFSSTPGHQIRECGQLLDDHLGKPASKTWRLLTQYLRSQLGRPRQKEGKIGLCSALFPFCISFFWFSLRQSCWMDPDLLNPSAAIWLASSMTLSRTSVHQGELSWEMLYPRNKWLLALFEHLIQILGNSKDWCYLTGRWEGWALLQNSAFLFTQTKKGKEFRKTHS